MSGANDQRGAEPMDPREDMLRAYAEAARTGVHHPQSAAVAIAWAVGEIDRLRAELAETRDRRDYLRGQLDLIYDAEYSRNDTLKRRIAVLEGAGNALADAAEALRDGSSSNRRADLTVAADSWRSAAGTPTTPEK